MPAGPARLYPRGGELAPAGRTARMPPKRHVCVRIVEELEWVLVLSDVEVDEPAGRVLAGQRPSAPSEADLKLLVDERSPERSNPVGNERLTAGVGIVLLVLTFVELGTILFGVHGLMSLHVFVGFLLIPPVLLKLGSTGWRFACYYSGNRAYRLLGPPRFTMRLLAPLLVATTVVLFASGVAMGILHGNALTIARRLHGPASVVWIVLVGVHVLVYLKRALISSSEDLAPSSRASVRGAGARAYVLASAIVSGVVIGIATVPAQHHWVNLPRHHHHDRQDDG
jgi:hypothetical protein